MNQQFYMLSENDIASLADQITTNILKVISSTKSPTINDFINIQETSELIGLAKSTIYGLVHRKKIPYYKVGKVLYFSREGILKWISDSQYNTKSDIK